MRWIPILHQCSSPWKKIKKEKKKIITDFMREKKKKVSKKI